MKFGVNARHTLTRKIVLVFLHKPHAHSADTPSLLKSADPFHALSDNHFVDMIRRRLTTFSDLGDALDNLFDAVDKLVFETVLILTQKMEITQG